MATIQNTLSWKAVMDASSFGRGNAQVQRGLQNTEGAADGTARGMGGLNTAVKVFIAAGAAKQLGSAALEAVKMGQAAAKAGEAANQVLGPAAEMLRDRFDRLRLSAGLTEGEFDGLLAQMGLMTDSMVDSDEAQGEYIGRMLDMAGALAQFNPHGGDTADALEAIFSGLKNNFNPLEQFGLKLKKADVNERAAELQEYNDKLTDSQAEFEAFIDLMEDKGAPAIQAYDEDLETLETQQGEMAAQWGTMKEQIGQVIAPAFQALATGANAIFDALFTVRAFLGGGGWRSAWDKFFGPPKRMLAEFGRSWDRLMGRLDRLKSKLKGIKFPTLPSGLSNFLSAGRFASGGTVPGPRGQPRMIMAHGGETVGGLGGTQGNGGGSPIINISMLVGDPQETARAVVEALETYQRGNGPIPIDVSGTR